MPIVTVFQAEALGELTRGLLGLGELTWGLLGRCCWWCSWEQRPFQSQVLLLYAAWFGYEGCWRCQSRHCMLVNRHLNGPPLWAVNPCGQRLLLSVATHIKANSRADGQSSRRQGTMVSVCFVWQCALRGVWLPLVQWGQREPRVQCFSFSA